MEIPIEIKSVLLKDEEIDFCVYSKLFQKRSKSVGQVFIGILFATIPLICFYLAILKSLRVKIFDGVLDKMTLGKALGFVFPSIIIIIFVLIGLSMFFGGIIYFSAKGGYFIGTNQRFISFRKGSFKSYDWEQFDPLGAEIHLPDSLLLKLRTGSISRSYNKRRNFQSIQSERFIQNQFWIVGIENVNEVAQKCNFRIELNKVDSSLT